MRHNLRTKLNELMFRGIFILCIVLIGFKLHKILTGQVKEKVPTPVALTAYRNNVLLKLSTLKRPNQIRTVHPVIEEKVKYF